MSNKKEWWRPTNLPPSGYRLKSDETIQGNTSFYPFNTELGYRIFKRLLEIERLPNTAQEDNIYRVETIKQIDRESNHYYVKGLCSQNPTAEEEGEEEEEKRAPLSSSSTSYQSNDNGNNYRLVPSNYQPTLPSNEEISEDFHLHLKFDIDFDDL